MLFDVAEESTIEAPSAKRGLDRIASRPLLLPSTLMALNAFVFVGGLVAVVWMGAVTSTDIVLLLVFHGIAITGLTVGYHRLFSHRAFVVGPCTRAALGIAGALAAQGPITDWVSRHRQHHRFSDREGDMHSPHWFQGRPLGLFRGLLHASTTWLAYTPWAGPFPFVKDLESDPVVQWVDRWHHLWLAAGLALPALIGWTIYGTAAGAISGLFWGGILRVALGHLLVSSVNSICHLWGSRPFATNDHSRNNLLLALVTNGDGWHNNHHAFPNAARHGFLPGQPDFGWRVIRALERLGLAWNVKRIPDDMASLEGILEARRTPAAGVRESIQTIPQQR